MPKGNVVWGSSNFSLLHISKSCVPKVKIVWGFSKFLCIGLYVLAHDSLESHFADVIVIQNHNTSVVWKVLVTVVVFSILHQYLPWGEKRIWKPRETVGLRGPLTVFSIHLLPNLNLRNWKHVVSCLLAAPVFLYYFQIEAFPNLLVFPYYLQVCGL